MFFVLRALRGEILSYPVNPFFQTHSVRFIYCESFYKFRHASSQFRHTLKPNTTKGYSRFCDEVTKKSNTPERVQCRFRRSL